MSGAEYAKVTSEVNNFNKVLNDGKVKSQDMGKDEFLKILITQLQNQDPTKPMEDKEFISQMAQFSSLEQMNNLNTQFEKVSNNLASNQAVSLLGKNVSLTDLGGNNITGRVEAVTSGAYPQIQVNNRLYDYSSLEKVTE
ncbi:flagellar hook assembly protein FlgD [Thiospirochaeta perfilievii]|uniref:Basal-body rod modification protein FlgD n=2 Tax=Thiospirochaeta perfilievii TaxID=252967 RepID=A0A5C1QGC4_9SPIO|nr:flagellar hook assembly protein FlgD [Thiospirochaeta perfilievii]